MVRIRVKQGDDESSKGREGVENTLWLQPDGSPSLTDEVLGQYLVQDLRESAEIYGLDLTLYHVSECQGKEAGPKIYVVAAAMFKGEELPQLVDAGLKSLMIFTMFYGAEKFEHKRRVRDGLDSITVPKLEVFGELPQEVMERFPIDKEFAEKALGYNKRTTFGHLYYET
ncbi:hypothetical protein KY336_00870 [Candidatus Woesearchaeota archaeon]|nr:hypothetical protein [Candidatus Woesearchaeota archaeon]